MMVSFSAVFFPRGVLDEILNLIESVSEGFLPTLSDGRADTREYCCGLYPAKLHPKCYPLWIQLYREHLRVVHSSQELSVHLFIGFFEFLVFTINIQAYIHKCEQPKL